nr:hypothetical protein CFP56_27188 [Quercus suber]
MKCKFFERSYEEKAELERSTKRANGPGSNDGDGEPSDGIPKRKQGSYKETFTGSLPGAYVEAFSFKADMEEDACSDDKMNDLAEGVVVVRLSKSTKLCIKGQWSNAIVIKVFRWSVGYHFLYDKFMETTWKNGLCGFGEGILSH